jgi:hypothetical protein
VGFSLRLCMFLVLFLMLQPINDDNREPSAHNT